VIIVGVALLLTSLAEEAEARRRGRKAHKKAKPAATAVAAAPAPEAETGDAPDSAGAPEAEHGEASATAAGTAAKPGDPKKVKGPKVMDFTGLAVEGKLRTPQLLYFLGRVKEELNRASLENRSFMPELVRSVDEGAM
jgi:hypothetical protein